MSILDGFFGSSRKQEGEEATHWALPTSRTTGTFCAPMVLKMSLPSWPGTVSHHVSRQPRCTCNFSLCSPHLGAIHNISYFMYFSCSQPPHTSPLTQNSPVLNGKFGTSLYSHSHLTSFPCSSYCVFTVCASPPRPEPQTIPTRGLAR